MQTDTTFNPPTAGPGAADSAADRHGAPLAGGLTAYLADNAVALRYADLSVDAAELARHCILDTLGVLIAGADDPVARQVRDMCLAEGAGQGATLLWHGAQVSRRQAALANGTAAHALDYDDNNLTMPGHVSAVVLPAVLAAAQGRGRSGQDLITAFAAGFETACSLGNALAPAHYDHGFHATGTNGAFGATAGAAHVLRLDAQQTRQALSITATTAAGLKGLFGTMCKPFHAGRGAENGVLAAQLAQGGFQARGNGIECRQGYALTHTSTFDPARALYRPASGWHLFENLFKYHAACYGTHGAIECALRMRQELPRDMTNDTSRIAAMTLTVAEDNDKTCNIALPTTAAEARFSLRHVVAMGLAGYDTAAAEAFGGASLADPEIARLRALTQVKLRGGVNIAHSFLDVRLADGQAFHVEVNAGLPATDLPAQRRRLLAKFHALVEPVAGAARARELADMLCELERLDDVDRLVALCQPDHE
jgi:2-methylcitrate dehydratase PrpD